MTFETWARTCYSLDGTDPLDALAFAASQAAWNAALEEAAKAIEAMPEDDTGGLMTDGSNEERASCLRIIRALKAK